jgi:hypothetical protein
LVASLSCLAFGAQADVTTVTPGTGTLAQAVAEAESGDTLLLPDGSYLGDVTIDKSLTIRAFSRAAVAHVSGGAFIIGGAGIDVTLQGLTFDTVLDVDAAASVAVLENRFLANRDLSLGDYQSAQGDGALVVIGNHFETGGDIRDIRVDEAYIAGNRLIQGSITADAGASIWIVGNDVAMESNNTVYLQGQGEARIIGNRVYASSNTGGPNAIATTHPIALISGNVVILERKDDTGYGLKGIIASGNATVANNTVYSKNYNNNNRNAITIGSGRVTGNIIYRFNGTPIDSGTGLRHHNLCVQTFAVCGAEADGNVGADPQFVDFEDFRLAEGSPAIDAGPEDAYFADIDRSRNDIGAHGGPWSIGHYDAQRDPDRVAPYVFPLFKANAGINDGEMHIRALGAARLR